MKNNQESELYQRLMLLVDKYGNRKVSRFATIIGVPSNTFGSYLSKEGQKKIKYSLLLRILEKFPEINEEWLLLGKGPMLKNENTVKEESEPYQASQTEITSELSSEFLAQAHLVEVVTKKLKEANAPDEVIQQAILAIVAPDVKCKKTEDKKIEQNKNCA